MNLFDIEGVTRQREAQCGQCPDGSAANYSPEEQEIMRERVRPHRCHATPERLCAGPLRPKARFLEDARRLEINIINGILDIHRLAMYPPGWTKEQRDELDAEGACKSSE